MDPSYCDEGIGILIIQSKSNNHINEWDKQNNKIIA